MPTRIRLSPELRALAAAQAGVLSRQQLLRAGLGRSVVARMLADGLLQPLTPGIYTFGAAEGWLCRAWAGVLLGDDRAVLGFGSAAHLLGLQKDEPSEITVFTGVQRAFRPGWRFIKGRRRGQGEPPRTSTEATVLDLCSEADEDEIAAALANAISGRRTNEKRLRSELATRSRMKHRAIVREVLGDVAMGAHSAFERRFLVDVERAHHLPTAARQRHAHQNHRSDAWYEEYRLLLELDSKLHHSGGSAFADMARDNDHALLGLTTLRLGWRQVTGVTACETARLLGRILASRGWEGPIVPCPRCRLAPLPK